MPVSSSEFLEKSRQKFRETIKSNDFGPKNDTLMTYLGYSKNCIEKPKTITFIHFLIPPIQYNFRNI